MPQCYDATSDDCKTQYHICSTSFIPRSSRHLGMRLVHNVLAQWCTTVHFHSNFINTLIRLQHTPPLSPYSILPSNPVHPSFLSLPPFPLLSPFLPFLPLSSLPSSLSWQLNMVSSHLTCNRRIVLSLLLSTSQHCLHDVHLCILPPRDRVYTIMMRHLSSIAYTFCMWYEILWQFRNWKQKSSNL